MPEAAAPAQREASLAQVSAVSGSAASAVTSLCQSSIQSRATLARSGGSVSPRLVPEVPGPRVLPSLPLLPSIALAHREAGA